MDRRTALALGLASAAVGPRALAQEGGWTTLLDGTNMLGWMAVGEANWNVADGVVQADTGSGMLVSKETYSDFELRVEAWISEEANSGVMIRCQDPAAIGPTTAYEVNLWDKRPDPSYGSGSLVLVAKVEPIQKAGGRWNVLELRAKGPRFDITLNGVKTVDGAQDAKFAKGHIGLQHGSGIVKFRKVQIRQL